jgi:hypothetical protein
MKKYVVLMGMLAVLLVFGTEAAQAQEAEQAQKPAASEDYEDFNGGLRFGTWALNAFVFPGLGSYVFMHDKVGGTVQVVGWTVGTIAFVGVLVNVFYVDPDLDDDAAVDRHSLATNGLLFGGSVIWIAIGIYNIVRSVTYHKPRPKAAALFDPDAWDIAILPGKDGIEKVQLSYTLRY